MQDKIRKKGFLQPVRLTSMLQSQLNADIGLACIEQPFCAELKNIFKQKRVSKRNPLIAGQDENVKDKKL